MNEKSIFSRLLYVAKMQYHELHYLLCIPIIQGWYGGFGNYRHKIKSNGGSENMYYAYLMRYNAFVGLGANIQGTPMLPHGLNGIHISDAATIGEGCVILQQVTIGSNTTKGSKHFGSPTIGKHVFIGAGAKIIGNVRVGDNCRIGANCVVVKDMPDNSTAILRNIDIIIHDISRDNSFKGIYHFEE